MCFFSDKATLKPNSYNKSCGKSTLVLIMSLLHWPNKCLLPDCQSPGRQAAILSVLESHFSEM